MNKYILFVIITLFIIFLINSKQNFYNNIIQHYTPNNQKTLVLYTFHIYNNNVEYFIKKGIFKDDNIDFIFIINDPKLKVDVPDYVKIINRENKGYDFGAWSEGLLTNNLYMNYDYFIFANSSVIGPILPTYYKGKWTDIFLDGLTDTIKLYGCTINTCGLESCNPNLDSHVQSYVFCTDKIGINILINKEIFSLTYQINNWEDVVRNKEIRMSREIINSNYNIGCVFNYYKDIDFRQTKIEKALNDLTHNRHFFNENLHPYEVIFIKEKYIANKEWINNYIL
jgi:hypothetical protein